MTDKHQLRLRAASAHRRLLQQGMAAGAAWVAVESNPTIGTGRVLEQQRVVHADAQRTADDLAAQTGAVLEQFDREYVSGLAPPTFEPSSSAHNSRIALLAQAIMAGQLAPPVLAREVTTLIAQRDTYGLWFVSPYLESSMSFRKPFLESPELAAAVFAANDYLQSTPELTTRREDRQWLEDARADLAYARQMVSVADPREKIQLVEQLGAMGTLGTPAPDQQPASFGYEQLTGADTNPLRQLHPARR